MITVASYLKGIPPNNRNPEKPALLRNFITGVNALGDRGFVVDNNKILGVDVAVIQGWVHADSKNVPHLNLRKLIYEHQIRNHKRCIIVDSNLFLYSDPSNSKGYLRYSYDGVFPDTGEYCWDNPDPLRWQQIFKDLNLKLRPWHYAGGGNILICAQRDGGWSMNGQDTFAWTIETINKIKAHTDRQIVVRFHPGDRETKNNQKRLVKLGLKHVSVSNNIDFRQDIKNAWALVNYNSSPAVAAVIEGVPAFVLDRDKSQAKDVAHNNLAELESPTYFDREQWIRKVAMSHWNHNELKCGACWSHMRKWALVRK